MTRMVTDAAARMARGGYLALALLFCGCIVVPDRPRYVAQPAGDTAVFYDTLSPYGEWLAVGQFGRVWRPYPNVVGADFVPYATGGSWVSTDQGWAFESRYDWGWAPFHYGRWYQDAAYGWVWVPGNTWAPAWVDWRYGGGYVGWVPLAPPGVQVAYYRPSYCYVETRYFGEPEVHQYLLPPAYVHQASAVTVSVHDYHSAGWYRGPPPSAISSETGRPIQTVTVRPPPSGTISTWHAPPPAAVGSGRPPPSGYGMAPPPPAVGSGRPPPSGYGMAPPPAAVGSGRPPPSGYGMAPPPAAVGSAPSPRPMMPPPAAVGSAPSRPMMPPPAAVGSRPPPPRAAKRPEEKH